MKNQVYVIYVEHEGKSMNTVLDDRSKLHADIQLLAIAEKADVHMHEYAEPQLGFPVILVECDAAFLAKIEKLPRFGSQHEVWADVKTVRWSDMPQIEAPESMGKTTPKAPTPPRR